jgi:diguanylate cyclase (GGDEF)-like protein/putative nucleotidyltransferase with HDIG domain
MTDKDDMETLLDPKMIQRKNEIGALFNSVNQMQTKILDSFKIIEYFNFHDPLTNLYNRRYYENNLNKLDIPKNLPLTIVVSDINGLKLINDAFGHGEGDRFIVSAANIILNSCRTADLIARTGGDEFVIIMPNTNESTTEKIIDKINEKIKKIDVSSIKLSISFGFKTKNNIDEDICKIYKTAEDLMYREKLLVIPSMRSGAIETILNALHEKDKSSEIHSRVVSKISEKIALACKMNRQDVSEIKTAGLLHDIGKIMIPTEIILKNGKLTNEEYKTIKKHSEIGFRILNSSQNMGNIANIVLSHHERWDGLGYPRGIKGYDIPLQSRIISIADSFDAMTSKRTYQKICTNEDALAEIVRCSGTQFDPELVKIFKDNFHMIIKEKV